MNAFEIGDARIHRIEEATYKLPLAMFKVDQGVIERNAGWLFPNFADANHDWEMVVQSWMTIVDDKVVVVDPCVGNGRSFPTFPLFDRLLTPFIERFEATGIRPDQVDYVFCTHLHSDHCGWNTQLRGGRYVPTFPNARYILVKREFDRWDPSRSGYDPAEMHNLLNAGVFENSVQPVVEAGLADLVSDTHRITESLVIEPAYGHTAGHSVLHLTSNEQQAYFTGDLFHHPLELLYPGIDAATCERYPLTVESRQRVIDECAESGALIIAAHFAAPHAGYVRRRQGELAFEPLAA